MTFCLERFLLSFYPIGQMCFGISCGLIHEEASAFLAKVAAESRKIPQSVMYIYFLKRLSLRLQCGIANSINRRLEMVKSHNSVAMHDPSFALDIVLAL